MQKTSPKRPHFVASNQKAKSKIIARFVQMARKERLSYDDFLYVCHRRDGSSASGGLSESGNCHDYCQKPLCWNLTYTTTDGLLHCSGPGSALVVTSTPRAARAWAVMGETTPVRI